MQRLFFEADIFIMLELTPTWLQAKEYISMGLALFAVRDKAEQGKQIKAPLERGWKDQRNTELTLYDKLQFFDTTGIGIICGNASGGLHVIDVDTKFLAGFDAILFADIKNFYPEIWEKLRIHKTPSGGYHLLYRLSENCPGNKKLAGISKDDKTEYFIETRGEGGFIAASPSMGYEVIQNRPIPLLTAQDHASLIALCQSYTKLIEIEKPIKIKQEDDKFYSTNPWDDFNQSADAEMILVQNGWTLFNENSIYIYYTRPDRAEGGISASFHKEWRKFWICREKRQKS